MISFVYMGDNTSYGYSGIKLAQAFERLGGVENLDVLPQTTVIEDGRDWTGPAWECAGPAVALMLPEWLPHIHSPFLVVYTMWEGRGLPARRVAAINEHARLCLVPSHWCAESFAASGVTTPIAVVGMGVDGADYPLLDRSDHAGRPYRFLWNGNWDARKGWDLTYQAFWKAFRGATDVELVLHFREIRPKEPRFSDANVRLVEGYVSQEELRGLLQEADCYVFPSRAEGWGLAPREAACTGLPALVTEYAGLAEDTRSWAFPVRVCREYESMFVGVDDERFLIAEPCVNDLEYLMRWCYEHRAAAALVGRDAARWLREHGSWDACARGIVEAVQRGQRC